MDFVDGCSQIKSILWCHGAGNVGFNSLGRILKGDATPSGKAAGTFLKDFTQEMGAISESNGTISFDVTVTNTGSVAGKDVVDMASCDMSGNGRCVLESGDYITSINSGSHNIIDSQTCTVSSDVDYGAGRSNEQAIR